MSTCPYPHHKVRADIPEPPARIAQLPVDERGYPVPYFVQWVDADQKPTKAGVGKPEFRVMDHSKWMDCVKNKNCWICGQKLGKFMSFVLGPMCAVNRINSEPPSHHECATYAAKACPFLTKPQMVRREAGMPEGAGFSQAAGVAIERNPGATGVWTTTGYQIMKVSNGYLLKIGVPIRIEWYKEARTATRDEVMESIRTGLPALEAVCQDDEDRKALQECVAVAMNTVLPIG